MCLGYQNKLDTFNMEVESYTETYLPTTLHGVKHQETVINRLYDRGWNAAHAVRHQETTFIDEAQQRSMAS